MSTYRSSRRSNSFLWNRPTFLEQPFERASGIVKKSLKYCLDINWKKIWLVLCKKKVKLRIYSPTCKSFFPFTSLYATAWRCNAKEDTTSFFNDLKSRRVSHFLINYLGNRQESQKEAQFWERFREGILS